MIDLEWTQDTARLDSLELWDKNPKDMTKKRAKRLLASWEEMKQYQTLAVGPNGEVYDGHQRIKVLKAAGYKGDYEVAVMRSNRPLTEDERERVIIESTVGTTGRLNFDELAGWDADRLELYGLDQEALDEYNDAAANLALMLEAEKEDDENYSRKIEAPTYTPRGAKPRLEDLYDDSVTKKLIEAIDASETIQEEEKAFLRIAAQRHTVLNFSKIADYYAHSEIPMQELMEDNALVIIDFERAIELGFVEVTERMAQLVGEEYGR